jgi:hypothetical protein
VRRAASASGGVGDQRWTATYSPAKQSTVTVAVLQQAQAMPLPLFYRLYRKQYNEQRGQFY